MTVISSSRDTEALSLTFVAEFDAGVGKVWQLWEDPRQLERWWGPPTWPATFTVHDFVKGGESRYFMTGPEGEKAHGWWRFLAIDTPARLQFDDGFADSSGRPADDMPTSHATVTLEALGGGTRMTVATRFDSLAELERLTAMGMEEGMSQALGQIDAILA